MTKFKIIMPIKVCVGLHNKGPIYILFCLYRTYSPVDSSYTCCLTFDSSVIYDAYNETMTTMFYTFQISGINAFEMTLGESKHPCLSESVTDSSIPGLHKLVTHYELTSAACAIRYYLSSLLGYWLFCAISKLNRQTFRLLCCSNYFGRNVHISWPKRPYFLAETSLFLGRNVHISWPKRPCFLAKTSLKTGTFRPKSMAETDLGRNVPLPSELKPVTHPVTKTTVYINDERHYTLHNQHGENELSISSKNDPNEIKNMGKVE